MNKLNKSTPKQIIVYTIVQYVPILDMTVTYGAVYCVLFEQKSEYVCNKINFEKNMLRLTVACI